MKFGKLPNIDNVDFALPPDASGTSELLEKLPPSKPQLYVGCTGWGMKEWAGTVYPPKTKAKDYLHHYARQFSTIELNTTHYRIPTPETVIKWRDTAPADFRFCPKIPQSISHSSDMGMNGDNTLRFCENISLLEEKMGCCFIQLPPYFGFDRLSLLTRFLEKFPRTIPLAVELRHESWFNNAANFDTAFEVLQNLNISPVITDVAGRRDVLHQRLTNHTVLIRWVGNALHSTDYERIDVWVMKLKTWLEAGLQQVFFFPHEPDNLLAPDIAAYFIRKINEEIGLDIYVPTLDGKAVEDVSGQMSLF